MGQGPTDYLLDETVKPWSYSRFDCELSALYVRFSPAELPFIKIGKMAHFAPESPAKRLRHFPRARNLRPLCARALKT
jgi:hypothetical protein